MDFFVDPTKPPLPPPNEEFRVWPFIGCVVSKESKKTRQAYLQYLERYEEALRQIDRKV